MRGRIPSVTRKSDGCEFVHLHADPNDANRVYLLERWESRAKYETYRERAMAQSGTREAMSHLAHEPVWTYLDDTGI